MSSAVYTGWVRHRRYSPRSHEFSYRVFMPLLDLDDLPGLFDTIPLWSARRPALARFRREDYLGDPSVPLAQAVRERVLQETGQAVTGPVRMLANLRYFGFVINPISCYYCFEEDGETVNCVVAEVTNTPWGERTSYVLSGEPGQRVLRTHFDKAMHVSPFNPMDMQYHWRSNTPGDRLVVHLENHCDGDRVFDATMSLKRRPLSASQLNRQLLAYPFMTAKVAAAIYWQALRLWLKGLPFHPHPDRLTESTRV